MPTQLALDLLGERQSAPTVHFVNQILNDAISKHASDIHLEPHDHQYRIRFRIDGVLLEVPRPPLADLTKMIARIKVLSNLDISERRLPQDGQFHIKDKESRLIECRVSTCPTIFGEKVVIRLFNATAHPLHIHELGFSHEQLDLFLKAIHHPHGLILVTGPTGSGKTLTLYHALALLNTQEVNICTVEDPVEMHLPGVNQVNINPKAGLNFSNMLRGLLRQDPDIIMIGEIRDSETAEMAVSAAQTGHLVLSTLHTNHAAGSIGRLRNLGIPSHHLASALILIIGQRLVRKCAEEGYRGRMALYEMLWINQAIRKRIATEANCDEIAALAFQHGMKSLYQSGLEKVKSGLTTLGELKRVAVESS